MAYTRYLEIRITYGTYYDFEASNEEQKQNQLAKHPGVIDSESVYRAIYVSIDDIIRGIYNHAYSTPILWVSTNAGDSGFGKIRVNAHGDGYGRLYMKNEREEVKYADLTQFARWLVANGLRPNSQVKTINLAMCMAAQSGKGVASIVAGSNRLKPATDSAVDRLAKALTAAGCRGIKITGSNEITMVPGSEIPTPTGLKLHAVSSSGFSGLPDIEYLDDGTAVAIVPDGWNVVPGQPAYLELPKKCRVEPEEDNAKMQIPTGGWIVTAQSGQQFPILGGWNYQSGGFLGRGRAYLPYGIRAESLGANKGGYLRLPHSASILRDERYSYFKAVAYS
ncbi:MAG: hypothetical protein A3J38_06910 [Gammaproteobacteria bacterium RIFCSPHIGHO2_12_FULL_45_9]|nr:MAG: hypothetical protein A3J38_06910 [Gammaproteobacteria bacterium RIFCSPHIGHO2_12_FULL_45_9]